MKLTEHFTLEEMVLSQEAARSGLRNMPNAHQVESLRALCENVLEPLRARVKRPIIVSSGYRSKTLNARIGGSPSSQHCRGEAADIMIPGMGTAEVVDLIRGMKLPFDQVIDEFSRWVHVSHSALQRRAVLTARRVGGKTEYRRVA